MLCPACSTEVPAGSAFCPKCGARLGGTPAAAGTDKLRAAQAAAATNADPEQTLWQGRYSPKAMYGSWMMAIAVTIAGIVAGVFFPLAGIPIAIGLALLWVALLLVFAYRCLSFRYTLTTQRLLHTSGILIQRANRIETIDIDDVSCVQGIVARLFGVGTIKLLSSDTSDPTLELHGIANVQQVANLIDNARRDERRKRGLYMEKI